MNIMNFTPHEINIIEESSCYRDESVRKWKSANPNVVTSIPSSGILSVKIEVRDAASVGGTPVRNKVVVGIDPIPDDCDIAIVSGMYASFSDDPRAYGVIDPVFDESGTRVIGCLAIGGVK